jgi:type VI secretion system protein ImpC
LEFPRAVIPRVRLTYEVSTEAGTEARELPFVIGVLADLCGQNERPERRFSARTFVEIHARNFDDVLAGHAPRLAFAVENVSEAAGAPFQVELRFRSMADFEPEGVARQVPGLWEELTSGRERAARQLDALLHAPEFERLEASWRGLDFLVSRLAPSTDVKVRVLSASRRDLWRDLERAPRFDQSYLFKRVHDDIFGVTGADPFDILIGDYEFAHDAPDLALLRGISQVAAAIHAPFAAAAHPRMFGCGTFAGLPSYGRLREVLEDAEHEGWRSFRKSETAKHLALNLPRFLLRLPYGTAAEANPAFRYEEQVNGGDPSRYVWGNAAYVLAIKAAESFRRYGLPVAMRGIEHGFERALPIHTLTGADGRVVHQGPTETPIEDTQHPILTLGGFASLCGNRELGGAMFFTAPTCGLPQEAPDSCPPRLWVEARMRTCLPWVMTASRFAHYLRVIIRDAGPHWREACESVLNRWLARYVCESGTYGPGNEAYRPLKQAHAEVRVDSGNKGLYTAELCLEPRHPCLDEHSVPMRIRMPLIGQYGG